MDEEGRLRSVTQKAQAIAKARRPRPLADAVNQYIAECLEPRREGSADVTAAWKEIVPHEFAGCCRIAEIARGRVKIAVSSPSYLYQLRLSGPELLKQLQGRCGRRAVKELKFETGR